MSARLIAAVFAGFMLISPCAAQMSKEDAFNLGKQTGKDSTPNYDQMFSEENSQSSVPHGQSDEEKSSFWDDAGSKLTELAAEGARLLAVCMSNTEGPEDSLKCEAVRMIMGSNEKKVQKQEMVKEDDPMKQIRDAIMKNPEVFAGPWGGEYTDCEEFTLGGGSEFDYETCTEESSVAGEDEEYCTLGRTVVMDPEKLYQCTRTMSQLNSGQCSFGERVEIDKNSLLQCVKKPENRVTGNCNGYNNPVCVKVDRKACNREFGVLENSVRLIGGRNGSMSRDLNSGVLRLGATNMYHSGTDQTWTFSILNLERMSKFRLYHDEFHNGAHGIWVNGTSIFGRCACNWSEYPSYPYNCSGRCDDANGGWGLNKNVLHLLREGDNTIQISGYGSNHDTSWNTYWEVEWQCEPVCRFDDVWTDDCAAVDIYMQTGTTP
jgi:hypothetical protein